MTPVLLLLPLQLPLLRRPIFLSSHEISHVLPVLPKRSVWRLLRGIFYSPDVLWDVHPSTSEHSFSALILTRSTVFHKNCYTMFYCMQRVKKAHLRTLIERISHQRITISRISSLLIKSCLVSLTEKLKHWFKAWTRRPLVLRVTYGIGDKSHLKTKTF